jgi:proline dehydrogenase
VTVAQDLAKQSIDTTVDLLGENLRDRPRIEASAQAYVSLLEALHGAGLTPYISIKLTMLGLDVDPGLSLALASRVARRADELGGRVCLDMEGSGYTERTLAIYEQLSKNHKSAEIVLQAQLHRTREDIHRVLAAGGRMRLCKGAYKETSGHALQRMDEIRTRFIELLEVLLPRAQRTCIATHDDAIIHAAERLLSSSAPGDSKIPTESYEFQMLYGLRRRTWTALRQKGHNFTVYVPYGLEWQPYYRRRLAERKENVLFILKNFLRH